MEKTEALGRVASVTPGRVRVRLHRSARQPHQVRQIHQHVEGQVGVTRVETNPTTGSVVVHYDHESVSFDDVMGMFRDVGVVVQNIGELEEAPMPGQSDTSTQIIDAVDDFDRRLSRLTGHKLDLRLLFPAGLFALGLRQVLVEGLGLTQVPGYVLLWYAFDSFWKFHREPRSTEAKARSPESNGHGATPRSNGKRRASAQAAEVAASG